ncbi:unnamed protein product, partial [Gongylonema pulchrum]|uniref:L-type lectin-like domain-containing protein n=2 Tax=Gongylonema pulchrum TaxID=637853 RepID=A0A183EPL4_9BILA
MWAALLLLLSLLVLCRLSLLADATAGLVHRRFEYKHSFRAPDLSQRDGSIPFWTMSGDAVASKEQLRLAPSMRSRRGLAWNKRFMGESEHFEIQMAFRVTGQGRIGADGIGVWYTAHQPTLGPVSRLQVKTLELTNVRYSFALLTTCFFDIILELFSVFGANDYWTGMGLFLDSFDNDAQKNNPFIALMINDGTRQYDHQTDGSQ